LGVEKKRKMLPTDWHGLLEQGFRGRCFADQLAAGWKADWGGIEEEEIAHGLARIFTDLWMGVDRGLC